jgi:DMSO/TMAO reductase YedYZ molybdopterin-dependent catalytic subunit
MNLEEKDNRPEPQNEASQEECKGAPVEEQGRSADAEPAAEKPKSSSASETTESAASETPKNAAKRNREEPEKAAAEEPRHPETRIIHAPQGFLAERPPDIIEVPEHKLRGWSRRDLLFFGAGVVATIVGGGFLLPSETLGRWGITVAEHPGKERFLNHALNLDDDIAEALYSKDRVVPTYSKSDITPLTNNYNGATPDNSYLPGWRLTLRGLASGQPIALDIHDLLTRFPQHEQITRLVCVEGWSAIAWWSGLKFSNLLRAYPPAQSSKWARVDSGVNLDGNGNPDPYYASIDLATAQHAQTLLATHYNGEPLTVEHGAPLRLLAPMKLGLKNVKAITEITYSAEEPRDYWAERGYSRYDGL